MNVKRGDIMTNASSGESYVCMKDCVMTLEKMPKLIAGGYFDRLMFMDGISDKAFSVSIGDDQYREE